MKVAPEKGVYEVVWPRADRVVEGIPYAQRLDTLEGKTICELSNGLYRVDEIFPMMEQELANRYPGIKFVRHDVFGLAHHEEMKVRETLPSMLKRSKCDAVVSGIGC